MRRVGLLLDIAELDFFKNKAIDLILLPPGFPYPAEEVSRRCSVACVNLNSLMEPGEISALSERVAPAIRRFVSLVDSPADELIASQNDIYQYHLRAQYLFMVALERYLQQQHGNCTLVLAAAPYSRYYSPMRPEYKILYDENRLFAFLAIRLAKEMGVNTEATRKSFALTDALSAWLRASLLKVLLAVKITTKSIQARRRKELVKHSGSIPPGRPSLGIIVRTDSEVISASHLLKELEVKGIGYCLIHDELLSSTTTLSRLASLGIDSVSVGAGFGLRGALNSVLRGRPRVKAGPLRAEEGEHSIADQVLLNNPEVFQELAQRFHDFYVVQSHFKQELDLIVRQFRLSGLLTYAYVDQWGGIIKAVGDAHGIPTIAVQNAAQDPEEYPKLCWSDLYCVESHYLKRRLVDFGYPSDKILASGLPQFSSMEPSVNGVVVPDSAARNRRLMILTQPIYQTHFDNLIRECAQFCLEHQYELAIKYHPRQSGAEYRAVLETLPSGLDLAVFQSESLDDLILDSSAVVSVVSAALIRAINLGTPTISYLPLEEKHLDLYYANDATVFCVSTLDQLRALLVTMSEDPGRFQDEFTKKRSHYLAEHAVFEPGDDPVKNIVGALEKMILAK